MPTETPRDQGTSWANLFDLDEAERLSDRSWREQELGAIMRHQLSSPVQFDLQSLGAPGAARLQALCAAEGLLVKSFNDLLFHPHPPIELLEMTKRFAKASRTHRDALVPKDVALLLYYSSIMVALIRCGKRITGLSDDDLANGIRWALARPWLEEPMRQLLGDGLEKLTAGAKAAGSPSAAATPDMRQSDAAIQSAKTEGRP